MNEIIILLAPGLCLAFLIIQVVVYRLTATMFKSITVSLDKMQKQAIETIKNQKMFDPGRFN